MLGFFLFESLVRRESAEHIFRDLYFSPGWQTFFDVFHSIPLFLCLTVAFWWTRNRQGVAFALSLLLHAVVDWPTHLDDAHAYLWPFWRKPLPGFISYWHRGSPTWTFELGLILGALALWTRGRFTNCEDASRSDAHEFVKS